MYRLSLLFITLLFALNTFAHSDSKPFDVNLMKDGSSSVRVYLPANNKGRSKAVVICPGGGYSRLAISHEGYDWAGFFNEQGIAAIILKYRIPQGDLNKPLSDALMAMKLILDNSERWNIDRTGIGIMGSSAGGHLASFVATKAPDELRPAFQILFYPVISMDSTVTHNGSRKNFLGLNRDKEKEIAYSNELNVSHKTPMAFITLSDDDRTVKPINSIKYYAALQQQGIPVSMHIYQSGGHGWGIKTTFKYREQMLSELKRWLKGDPVRVFITAGQSNTDGRIDNKLLPSKIKSMAKDTISFTSGKYKYCKISQNNTNGKFESFWPKGRLKNGVWAYDAVTYHLLEKALQEEFFVIKWAVGGTSISYKNDTTQKGYYWSADPAWLDRNLSTDKKGKSLIKSLTESIDESIDQTLSQIKRGYKVEAFLWHQGESDHKNGREYYQNLKGVIAHVRNHLTRKTGKDYSGLPFIFGSIPKNSRQYNSDVEEAMKRLAKEDTNAYLIDLSDGGFQGDKVHFNEKTAEYLGREMYKQLAQLLVLDTN